MGVSERGARVLFRGRDGRMQSAGKTARARNVRAAAAEARAEARTDMDALAAEFDYARAAVRAADRGGLDPRSDIQHAIRLLRAMGDALTDRLGAGDA